MLKDGIKMGWYGVSGVTFMYLKINIIRKNKIRVFSFASNVFFLNGKLLLLKGS